MAATFAIDKQLGGQSSAPQFFTKITLALLAADEYAAGGIAIAAPAGATFQAAVGAGKTIFGAVARGVLADGTSDGRVWHVNLSTNKVMAYVETGVLGPLAELAAGAMGANVTVEMVLFSV